MKTLSFVFVVALGVAAIGCSKKAGSDCTRAIDHSMELSKADMMKMPGMDDKMLAQMRDVGIQHCKADKWPAEVLTCMSDAKTKADAQACYGKLTQEQQDNMNQAAMKLRPAPAAGHGAATDDTAAPPASAAP